MRYRIVSDDSGHQYALPVGSYWPNDDSEFETFALAAMMDQEAMIDHAAQSIVAQAKGGAPPPPPVPTDPSQLMKSSVPVWESDYHTWEGKKCRDWLSSDERHTEESIGRPDPMTGELKPNMAGILNVFLHMKEHDAFALMEPPNPMVTGVMPAPNVASVPKPLPPPTPQQPGAARGAASDDVR